MSPIRADIFRWDTGEVIPGTEGIEPGPGVDLRGWNSPEQNLRFADFEGLDLNSAIFGQSLLEENWLQDARFKSANLADASLIGSNLTNADLSGTNLMGASLNVATLTDADFTDAVVTDVNFSRATITSAQLLSTASYQQQNLQGIDFGSNDLSGLNFRGQDLRSASFAMSMWSGAGDCCGFLFWRDADITNADFSGADLRGALAGSRHEWGWTREEFTLDRSSIAGNTIHSDGRIRGLKLGSGETLTVRDDEDSRTNWGPCCDESTTTHEAMPVFVEDGLSMAESAWLELVIDDSLWGSTISFEPGIDVRLDGTLELRFGDGVDPRELVGTTFQLFDWEGVSPSGSFQVDTDPGAVWDTAKLYSTGKVTLLAAVPEPASIGLLFLALGMAIWDRTK